MNHQEQAKTIEQLKATLDNVGGGVPLMGRDERAVRAILTIATVLQGAVDDLMWGSECPKMVDRLLDRLEDIIGTIRGTVVATVEENVILLTIDCEDVLLEMERARGADTGMKDRLRDWLKARRLKKLAAGMVDEPGYAPSN